MVDKTDIMKFLGEYELDLELALEIKRQKEAEELRLRLEEEARLRAMNRHSSPSSISYEETPKNLLHQKVQGAYFCSGSQRFSRDAMMIKQRSSLMNNDLIRQSSGALVLDKKVSKQASSTKKEVKEVRETRPSSKVSGFKSKLRPASTANRATKFKR